MPQVVGHMVCLACALVTLSAYPMSMLQVPSNTLTRRNGRRGRLEEAHEFWVDDFVPFEFMADVGAAIRGPKARGRHRSGHRHDRQERIQQPM